METATANYPIGPLCDFVLQSVQDVLNGQSVDNLNGVLSDF